MRKVLDKGYVHLEDKMGEDLSPVNDARVSYDKKRNEWSDKEKGLLNFLGKHDHTSPFRGSIVKLEMYAPLMIARQAFKYMVGSDHAEAPTRNMDTFTQWNETSRRYISDAVEFYLPQQDEWRSKPENSKQGSGEPFDEASGAFLQEKLEDYQELGLELYERSIEKGVAPELARLFLPAYGLYIRWRWTMSLQTVAHVLNQRLPKDSQKEFQDFAKAIYHEVKPQFPVALDALLSDEAKARVSE
ncbi:FAD-dependent thymidylate synthase (plasmid) [Halobacillus litoralis]|uniref:FAD-dependent thymidylate synthase n=1 Tax=Halobacillus litoralis TaxID=45668 RepID=UPI001CFEDF62|nr:FAD-dependent thymidylate synthase [Halobacillus litoralis]WLR49613.1 FAD-dependent thymidylate synthase [Halobacillus litoralis]